MSPQLVTLGYLACIFASESQESCGGFSRRDGWDNMLTWGTMVWLFLVHHYGNGYHAWDITAEMFKYYKRVGRHWNSLAPRILSCHMVAGERLTN